MKTVLLVLYYLCVFSGPIENINSNKINSCQYLSGTLYKNYLETIEYLDYQIRLEIKKKSMCILNKNSIDRDHPLVCTT